MAAADPARRGTQPRSVGFRASVCWTAAGLVPKGQSEISQPQGGWCVAQPDSVLKGRRIRRHSIVPPGRKHFTQPYQPLRSWLISRRRFATARSADVSRRPAAARCHHLTRGMISHPSPRSMAAADPAWRGTLPRAVGFRASVSWTAAGSAAPRRFRTHETRSQNRKPPARPKAVSPLPLCHRTPRRFATASSHRMFAISFASLR